MTSVPYGDRWIHAHTASVHLACGAVGLRSLEILEKIKNSAKMGARPLAGMTTSSNLKAAGEVRGKGLIVAEGIAADRHAKARFEPAQTLFGRVKAGCESRGPFARVVLDILSLALPLVI